MVSYRFEASAQYLTFATPSGASPFQRLKELIGFICIVLACGTPSLSQDTRTVSEPHIPPVCKTLDAQLTAGNKGIGEADEGKLDTDRIQQAIDSCQAGTAVELRHARGRNAFLSAPIELKVGITLLVAANTTLFASRNARDYDLTPGSCGKVDKAGHGCRPLIHVNKAHDAAIMGDGVIDGRGGANLLGQSVSWWDLAQEAKVKHESQNVPRIVIADQADGLILYHITFRNSPNFHVFVTHTNGFTVWGVKINTPKAGRNTDGIDPSSSSNVSILYSYINAGDDNVAIKAGASGPATHITVAHDHFYGGHGMSIGSETSGGVSAVEVQDVTIDGADNGIRIKSNRTRGGLVHDVAYRDVCIRNVKNPIVMETTYEHITEGSLIPMFEDILLQDVRVLGGGKISLDGSDSAHPVKLRMDGVNLSGVASGDVHASHARIVTGPGTVNVVLMGDDVEVSAVPGNRKVPSCDGRFVPMPGPQR
jgi:polygalacturonase